MRSILKCLLERSGTKIGNKGWENVLSVTEMVNLIWML